MNSINNQPVIAVVPTYNSSDLISDRVEQLLVQNFDQIIVCDDNSSDDTVEGLEKEFGNRVKIIAGKDNLGPAGNRNRCLQELSGNELVFFIDADCEIVYKNNLIDLIRSVFTNESVGVVGFSLLDKDGKPMMWNYGDLMHPVREAKEEVFQQLYEDGVMSKEQFIEKVPGRAASLRLMKEDMTKDVGWVAEGCMAMRANVLLEVGGFAAEMRYHETHDLCARVKESGYKIIFCPEGVARHLEFDSRMERRDEDFMAGRFYYYRKHWGMSETVFKRLHNQDQ